MAKTKDQIANDMYGSDYDSLWPGEKAAVTRAYNAQPVGRATARTATPTALSVEIGRVGVNGTKKCLMPAGSKVSDLLKQAAIELDQSKESIIAQSTGNKVFLTDDVKNSEVYVISPEIKSA